MPLAIYQPPAPIPVPSPPPVPGLIERWLWITPGNVTRELTAFVDGTEVIKGITGRYAPPVLIQRDVIPGIAGQRTREIHHDMREIDIPLFAVADDYSALQYLLSQLVRDMDPVAGVGILRHVAIDGTMSDLLCRCVGGLGMDSEGSNGPLAHIATLVFQADDPYWYGQAIEETFTGGAQTNWFNILPVHLGDAGLLGDVVIDNIGDVKAWPVWTIQGPGTNPVLTNVKTGEVMSLAVTLSANDRVIIDTRPGYKTIYGPGGVNWRQYLTKRALWGLVPDKNAVNLAMSGTTSSSYITLAYRPPFLVPGTPAPIRPDPVPGDSGGSSSGSGGGTSAGTYTDTYGGSY